MILHPPAYEDGTDSVPKRRLLELRRRGITQKKIYYIYLVTLHYYIKTLSEGALKILQIEMYFSMNISTVFIMPFGKQPTSCA